jgi:hypothetical protein
MSSSVFCTVIGNYVQISQPFSSIGYSPLQDGSLMFSLNNIIVNSESNSPYGEFRVDIFDYLTINQATLVVSGIFTNN